MTEIGDSRRPRSENRGAVVRGGMASIVVAALAGFAAGEPPSFAVERPADVLQRHGIDPSPTAVLEFLRQQRPSAERLARISALVEQLGSESFADREQASSQLAALGTAAVTALRDADKGNDFEIHCRAHQLLLKLDRGGGRQLHQELLIAALEWLSESPSPQATATLLEVLPEMPDAATRQAACEALWACVQPGDAEPLRRAIRHGDQLLQAAAIPALELASGDGAVDTLLPFLQNADESLRLSAARALLDRRPRPAVAALLGLLASREAGVRARPHGCSSRYRTFRRSADYSLDFPAAVRRWQVWAAGAKRFAAVGRKRLLPTRYGIILSESFAESAGTIHKTYHQLQYECSVAAKASVSQGVLRLYGNHDEGDQRLYATSASLLGLPAFPSAVRVKTTLGGEAAGEGTWHVGVSVGNVRVLFHPGMNDGAFRVERVDNHQFLTQNESMPFTPGSGLLHRMTIDVQRRPSGDVQLRVTIVDGGQSGRRFTRNLSLAQSDVGELGRIGLERSGRTGGAALFGSFAIEPLAGEKH